MHMEGKNMKKKVLSILLTLCLLVSLVPLPAMATGNGEKTVPTSTIAEGQNCDGHHDGWTCINNANVGELVPLIDLQSDEKGIASGNFYLSEDIDQITTMVIQNGITVNLCLNGHDLKQQESRYFPVIVIEPGGTLNLYDCNPESRVRYGKWEGNTYTIKETLTTEESPEDFNILIGGIITGGDSAPSHNISNPNERFGGGIHNEGTLNMYGGNIAGNTAIDAKGGGYCAAGVLNDGGTRKNYPGAGTFNMYGGSITGNKAEEDGGGVYNDGNGIINISGGSIANNIAKSGGGVYSCNGIITMTDGSIDSNTATASGGGIYNNGTSNLSGNVKISGNTKTETGASVPNNVFLPSGKTITLTDKLTDGAEVGVTTAADSLPVTVVKADADYLGGITSADAAKFVSDNAGYAVQLEAVDGSTAIRLCTPQARIVGGGSYATLADAVYAAKTGETVEILGDVTMTDMTIPVEKKITITSAKSNDDTQKTYTIRRGNEFTFAFFDVVRESGSLTLENITLDGNNVAAHAPLIMVGTGLTLTLGDGATLQNNCNNSEYEYEWGGAVNNDGIINLSGNVKMTGNTGKDNTVSNVYLTSNGTIILTGELTAGASIGVS